MGAASRTDPFHQYAADHAVVGAPEQLISEALTWRELPDREKRVRQSVANILRLLRMFGPSQLTHFESVTYDTLRRRLEKLSGPRTMQSYP